MSSTQPPVSPEKPSPEQPKKLTAADAAKKVRRTIVEHVDGKDAQGNPVKIAKSRLVAIDAAEVLSHVDHGTHVVVVTRDGQKFSSLGT